MYEERIILLRARSFDEAIGRAEKEAEEYCHDLDGCKYVGYVDVFHLSDEKIRLCLHFSIVLSGIPSVWLKPDKRRTLKRPLYCSRCSSPAVERLV